MSAQSNNFGSGIKVENILNREGDQLPFGYFEPSQEGKIFWMCNRDSEGRVTSVFSYDGPDGKEKKASYLETVEDAIFHRDELIKAGWLAMKSPEVCFKIKSSDGTEVDKPLNRVLKRQLNKRLKIMNQSNPFK